MISRYTRGTYIHYTLDHLSRTPTDEHDLRKLIAPAYVSMPRFHESVIKPLLDDGMIRHDSLGFILTQKGLDKLAVMGMPKRRMPVSTKMSKLNGSYDGAELRHNPHRPGQDDHERWPSRRGDGLYYRDGRVEYV